ncbi:hypothetical protein R3P38DRAFT_3244787 [Favolaschia claudopus]
MALKLVVCRAETIDWHPGLRDQYKKSPNLYVKVYDRKHRILKTKVVKQKIDPSWDESCIL